MSTAIRTMFLIIAASLSGSAIAQPVWPLPNDVQPRKVSSFSVVFGEGPVWHPDGYLLFSDLRGNTILRFDPANPIRDVFLNPSGGANGLVLDADTNLIMCRLDAADLARLESDGTISVLASEYDGVGFNGPNDVTINTNGTIFFTDPDRTQSSSYVDAVYALLPGGSLHRVDSTLSFANGIALSPDEETLYVNEGMGRRGIYAYDIVNDSTFEKKRLLASVADARYLDGMEVDENGFLIVAGGGGLWVYSPDGERIDKLTMSGNTTNVAWGPDSTSLYITKVDGLYRLDLQEAVTHSEKEIVPAHSALAPNYPNPVHASTTITYVLDRPEEVELIVRDVVGRTVSILDSSFRAAGTHRVVWDGSGTDGRPLSSGTYIYDLRVGQERVESRVMILAR